ESGKPAHLINAKRNHEIGGELDKAAQQKQNTYYNRRRRWTDAEWEGITDYIKTKYSGSSRVDWDEVGRRFGRTVKSLEKIRRAQGRKQLQLESKQLASMSSVPAHEKQALVAAIAACRDKCHGPGEEPGLDWDAVAKHMKRPLLDTLAIALNSRLSDLAVLPESAAKIKHRTIWKKARQNRLQKFINENYDGGAQINWDIAALYMHADSIDCAEAYELMTPSIYANSATPASPITEITFMRRAKWSQAE
ncbi:hypothetical protein EV174_006869, partial [Coemansia sp. RSA 2320]